MSKRRIVLVGGGSAGFYTAAAIVSNKRLTSYEVIVIHSPEIGVIGVGESTTASVPTQLNRLGFSWTDFFQKVEPVFKLGIQFTFAPQQAAWSSFYYPFEGVYAPVDHLRYDPGYYMLLEKEKVARGYNTHLMDLGRGPTLQDNKLYCYGFHFKNDRFISYLQNYCASKGAQIIEGTVIDCSKDERGYLKSVTLSNGVVIQGDLFVDNTGFHSLLLEGQMDEPWIPSQLLCDRAVTGSWARSPDQIKPFTVCEAMSAGWMWQIDHVSETNRGYVYSSKFISDSEAEKEFHTITGGRTSGTKIIKFRSGYRKRTWVKNVIGLGNSHAFVEPLESTGLHIMCQSANEFIKRLEQFSEDLDNDTVRSHYNEAIKEVWLETFDFIALHYKLCTTYDTAFWQACRQELVLGRTSQEVLQHYKILGPTAAAAPSFPKGNMFGMQGYYSLLMGLGVSTDCKNPVDAQEFERWQDMQLRMRGLAQRHFSSAEATYRSKFSNLY